MGKWRQGEAPGGFITLLLARVTSDWSTDHPSLSNLSLDKTPSYWSIAQPSFTTL